MLRFWVIRMAAADRNYSEVEINPESSGYGEQNTIQDPTTPEGNYSYSIPQETPETFLSAIQELGKTLLNNSEEMERRMTEKIQLQIDRLDDKIGTLRYPGHGWGGRQPEVNSQVLEFNLHKCHAICRPPLQWRRRQSSFWRPLRKVS